MPGPYRVVNGCVYAICFNIVWLTLWKSLAICTLL